jgi:F-type H+-transporting ATPase subunit delta
VNHTPVNKNIAKKYAQAFMAVFPKSLTFADMGKIEIAQKFLRAHKHILLFLQLPQFDHERKKSMVADLIGHFSLPDQLSAIILLLITRNRSFYIPDVLTSINELYKKQTNCIEFSLKSAHNLNSTHIESIRQFLKRLLDKNIITTSSIDTSLIAGIRLQSNDYLWEYSIRKHIQTLHALEK